MTDRDDFRNGYGQQELDEVFAAVGGRPRSCTLRATQACRREGGEWKVAHRHADTVTE